MAVSVALGGVLLNDGANPADCIQVEATLSDTPDNAGKVVMFGGGRLRYIQAEGHTRDLPLNLDTVSATQLAWLEEHRGRLLVMRDPTGRRHWCVYSKEQVTPYIVGLFSTVSVPLQRLTHPEAV